MFSISRITPILGKSVSFVTKLDIIKCEEKNYWKCNLNDAQPQFAHENLNPENVMIISNNHDITDLDSAYDGKSEYAKYLT